MNPKSRSAGKQQQQQQRRQPNLTALQDYPQTVTLTLYVPSSSVGALIGRRGQNIEQIQKTSGARLSIVSHDSPSPPSTVTPLDFSNTRWTPVVIQGKAASAVQAGQLIAEVTNYMLDHVIADVPVHDAEWLTTALSTDNENDPCLIVQLSATHQTRIFAKLESPLQLEGELVPVADCLAAILGEWYPVSINLKHAPSPNKLRHLRHKHSCQVKKKKSNKSCTITIQGAQAYKVKGLLEAWDETQTNKQTGAEPEPDAGEEE